MTRVFLAAGVAALAIAAPASAGPHGGGKGNQQAQQNRGGGGGGGHAPSFARGGGGGGNHGGGHAQMFARGGGGGGNHGGGHAQVFARGGGGGHAMHAQGFAMQRQQQHVQRQHGQGRAQAQTVQRQHGNRAIAQNRMAARQQMRDNRIQAQNQRHAHANQQAQARQMRTQRMEQAHNMRVQRFQQAQNEHGRQMQQDRFAQREQLRAERMNGVQTRIAENGRFADRNARGLGVGGCPPGLVSKGCMPPGLANKNLGALAVNDRVNALRTLGDARFLPVANFAPRREIFAPLTAAALLGVPFSTAATFGTFSPFPQDLAYLYPATPNYYYQYGNGYAYQIDRGSGLIDALLPLLAGGYMPGSYLPSYYMNSYVPSYYGLDSFYPSSFDYGYGYGNLCNRYGNGVIYQVDCYSGMVENVIPLYAGGYGVGQMLPSAYNYYNVPMQYRSYYYPTADYSYWYAPGAIYQYDTRSSLITSVAALMSPGFTIGQPLPAGYGMYNVPLDYRATYYDTPNAWYRYNNGYIYQVDPTTQLVTAIVASLLT